MRIRKQAIGDKNFVGKKIEDKRRQLGMKQRELLEKLNEKGVELNSSGLSKIEGQLRGITDYELKAIAEILSLDLNELLEVNK